MGISQEKVRTNRIQFRVLTASRVIEPGVLMMWLIESRTRVHSVRVSRGEIRWRTEKALPKGGVTSAIVLEIDSCVSECSDFSVDVEYSGGPPVVGGIVRGEDVASSVPKPVDDPATRIERRRAAAKKITNSTTREQYLWFTRLEERSDENVLHYHPPKDPSVDIAEVVRGLRKTLASLLDRRILSASADSDAGVCNPGINEFSEAILLIRERIFDGDLISIEALKRLGSNAASAVVDAFLAFCQGDLRVTGGLSDVNVEPDSAMVFLFAEFALDLLLVVDEVVNPSVPVPEPIPERLRRLALSIAADPAEREVWKRLAAAFVVGQRAYLRAYSPRRIVGPARVEDYVVTNFDKSEKLTPAELAELRKPYDELQFVSTGPSFSDPAVRQLAWRHALNASEAFPGSLEMKRIERLGPLAAPNMSHVPPTVVVPLRPSRGSSTAIRRHVRREIASIAPFSIGISMGATLQQLGFDEVRRGQLQLMLTAYCSAQSGRAVDAKKLSIGANTTIDELALRVDQLVD